MNYNKVLTFRIVLFKLFHIFIMEGIKESLDEDSLQGGKITSFHFSTLTFYYTLWHNTCVTKGIQTITYNIKIQWWIWLTGNQTQYHWIYKYFLSLLINNDEFFKTGTLQ